MSNINIENLQTGDILLFTRSSGNGLFFDLFDSVISFWSSSPFVHCAFVLKDPEFIHPTLKGLFIWESGWEYGDKDPQDNKSKLGVQITPIYEYLRNSPYSSVFVRKFEKGEISQCTLLQIHQKVYNKPYDTNIFDWLGAAVRDTSEKRQTDRFWCSAFVSYILVHLDFIGDVNWDLTRPQDLSSMTDYPFIHFLQNCTYGKDERIL
tara:strand:- start:411 stop:1031 length:621 start_codon:yes stop_codon:yes gene_type:complete